MLSAYGLSLGFWLVCSVLVSWQMLRERAQEHLQSVFSDLLLLYAVRYTSVALLTPPLFYLVKRWPITGRSMRAATLYLLGYPLFCLVFALIRWTLLPPWMHETLSWGARSVDNLLRLSYDTFADLFLLYLGVLSAAHAYAYFLRSSQQELEGLEMRQSLVQSELQALRAQIQPHFLFNTLQGISTLIDTNRSMAQDMLAALAALLRTVVKHHSADLVPFRNEVRFLQAYLSLERMRLGPRLEVQWTIAEEAYGALIPQLLLQPLIENALVHGIEPARVGGWLRVDVRIDAARLQVTIENSIGGHSRRGFGVGLRSVRQRLKYLYGDDALLEFALNTEEHTARARLEVPTFDSASRWGPSSEGGDVPARAVQGASQPTVRN
jgi:two-component system LytT family sensor kinase